MELLMRNTNRHLEIIDYLLNLLEENNIDITNESVKDYLINFGKYDSMWKDYRKKEKN